MPKPLTPISDNTRYTLRKAPTHSIKFLENTEMVNEIKKRKQGEENQQTTKPLKLRLTVVQKKCGRPKKDEKEDEEFFKTFGHKITKPEANTKRGTPTDIDILYFEQAKLKVEHQTTIEQLKLDIQPVPKIRKILFNSHLIDTWYVAPYPEEYSVSSVLYICEYCMKYMKSSYIASRHRMKCKVYYPPGDEIYRDGKISIFEVDGRKNKMYCQNLCLMAKMFLDHKTLYYDVEPFLFYIMTEADEQGCHFVGYFSKEKRSSQNYNVSCILTMPIFQRKGYGQFLIDFSYLLSKKENKTGSPERPLSDLGLLSYRSYWKNALFRKLAQLDEPISIEELSARTSLTPDDIISTLQNNDMIQQDKETNKYKIIMDLPRIRMHLQSLESKNYILVDPEKLTWTPFILSKDRLAPLLNTVKDIDESADVDIDD